MATLYPKDNADADAGNAAHHPTDPAAYRTTAYSPLRATVALVLFLGTVHFNAALVLVALLLLPARLAAAVFGLILFFMVIPLNDKNRWGRRLSRFICKYTCGYFPVTLHVEDVKAFDPNQAYVFGYEPHSVFPFGVCALMDHMDLMPLPKIKFLATSAAFHVPFLRQLWTWLGFAPVTRKRLCGYLADGYSCILVPGGLREMYYMNHDTEVVFLKERRGFIRIAMEMGRPLVPVFCFGQTNVYKWWKPRRKIFVKFASIFKFPPMIFWGRIGSPMPFQQPMHVVVGKPIKLKRNSQPTIDEINEVHVQFVAALEELFEKYKTRVGHADLHLIVQ